MYGRVLHDLARPPKSLPKNASEGSNIERIHVDLRETRAISRALALEQRLRALPRRLRARSRALSRRFERRLAVPRGRRRRSRARDGGAGGVAATAAAARRQAAGAATTAVRDEAAGEWSWRTPGIAASVDEAKREQRAVAAHQQLGVDRVVDAGRVDRQAELRERQQRHARGHDHRVADRCELGGGTTGVNAARDSAGPRAAWTSPDRRDRRCGRRHRTMNDSTPIAAASASGQASDGRTAQRVGVRGRVARGARHGGGDRRGRRTVGGASLRDERRAARRGACRGSGMRGRSWPAFRRGGVGGAVDGIPSQRAGQQRAGAGQTRAHGVELAAADRRHLGVRALRQLHQDEHVAVMRRQRRDRRGASAARSRRSDERLVGSDRSAARAGRRARRRSCSSSRACVPVRRRTKLRAMPSSHGSSAPRVGSKSVRARQQVDEHVLRDIGRDGGWPDHSSAKR